MLLILYASFSFVKLRVRSEHLVDEVEYSVRTEQYIVNAIDINKILCMQTIIIVVIVRSGDNIYVSKTEL